MIAFSVFRLGIEVFGFEYNANGKKVIDYAEGDVALAHFIPYGIRRFNACAYGISVAFQVQEFFDWGNKIVCNTRTAAACFCLYFGLYVSVFLRHYVFHPDIFYLGFNCIQAQLMSKGGKYIH